MAFVHHCVRLGSTAPHGLPAHRCIEHRYAIDFTYGTRTFTTRSGHDPKYISPSYRVRSPFRHFKPFAMVTNPPGAGLTPGEADPILVRAKSPLDEEEVRGVVETLEEVSRKYLLPTSRFAQPMDDRY